jgi:hypothetical protein
VKKDLQHTTSANDAWSLCLEARDRSDELPPFSHLGEGTNGKKISSRRRSTKGESSHLRDISKAVVASYSNLWQKRISGGEYGVAGKIKNFLNQSQF